MYFLYTTYYKMWIWNKALTSVISLSMLVSPSKCSVNTLPNPFDIKPENLENVESNNLETSEIPNILEVQESTNKEISVCLTTDNEESFTHTKVLESITDPRNTVLEFPLSQLFQKYWNRPHPLAVRWIDKNLTSLLWEHWIEELSDSIPQKLSPREEKITSATQYEAWDTLRFSLIDPLLQWVFPQKLSQQLKEDWFETFSDSDAPDLSKNIKENQNSESVDKKSDFVYDIVVKKLPSWEWVMGLYRDWELFMATYVSVWLPVVWTKYWKRSAKTKRWQFKMIKEDPYYYSRKYKSPMPCWINFDEWWFWFHQWKVRSRNREWIIKRWFPASHGCIRLPWVYASSLYSLVKCRKHVDVFISKKLYK